MPDDNDRTIIGLNKEHYVSDLIWTLKSSETREKVPEESILGVKFSQDTFISESWLIQHNISYQQSDLEDTPYGRCARIKHKEEEKDA